MPQAAQYVGYVAGAATVVAYAPQVWRAWKTKETKDLAWGMLALLVAAAVLWIAYGVLSKDWPVIATNVGTLALNVALVVAKKRFD